MAKDTVTSSKVTSSEDTSFSTMSVADVEAIGAHCQMPFCHQLDFLPFRCESCRGTYCLDHRSETAHKCTNEGAWARRRQQALAATSTSSSTSFTPKPNILNHEQQCSEPSCKTLINTPLVTGVHCDTCRRSYCLKHRFTYEHNCANLKPLGLQPAAGPTQKERGLAALEKLRAWGSAKKASVASTKLPSLPSMGSDKPSSSNKPLTKKQTSAARLQALTALKKSAKGDAKIPLEKRIYLTIEASSETLTAKIPRAQVFYHAEWSVGRVLDLAAKSLQVENLNNRANGEEERLRVFHIEGGKLLEFGEKLGIAGGGVNSGDTLVLLRGVGPAMAKTPDQV